MRICIEKTADGQFMVGQMDEGAEPQMQPVGSLDEAFKLAARILSAPMEGETNPFDEGMAKTAPRLEGMP